jgi:serine/threonine protein kinase
MKTTPEALDVQWQHTLSSRDVETMATRVQRDGPLKELDAVGWIIRLSKRVEVLHQLGVAHGGISADVVLAEGTSRTARGVMADVRDAAIRPGYHSPERHAGQGLSPADDAWGLAVTLYYLLAGQMPFAGETVPEIHGRIKSTAPAPLAVFDVGDDDLQRVLDQFLSRDRAKRVSRVSTLRSLLEAWHPDPDVSQLPPLEESDDDSSLEDDDDDVATVMRDFTDVRAQLEAMGAMELPEESGTPEAEPSPAAPPGPAPAPPVGWLCSFRVGCLLRFSAHERLQHCIQYSGPD